MAYQLAYDLFSISNREVGTFCFNLQLAAIFSLTGNFEIKHIIMADKIFLQLYFIIFSQTIITML